MAQLNSLKLTNCTDYLDKLLCITAVDTSGVGTVGFITKPETELKDVVTINTKLIVNSSAGTNTLTIETGGRISAGSFNAKSDARLKENFRELKTEKYILDLPTYKFDFINGAKDQIGCKAQDLQEICPEIVNEGDNGYLSIQENKIVYLLLEEVKKLREEIDRLRG